MKTFITASKVKSIDVKVDERIMDRFINSFNSLLLIGRENKDGSYTLSTRVEKMPTLNENEFALAVKLAKEKGWNLTKADDPMVDLEYKMTKII